MKKWILAIACLLCIVACDKDNTANERALQYKLDHATALLEGRLHQLYPNCYRLNDNQTTISGYSVARALKINGESVSLRLINYKSRPMPVKCSFVVLNEAGMYLGVIDKYWTFDQLQPQSSILETTVFLKTTEGTPTYIVDKSPNPF